MITSRDSTESFYNLRSTDRDRDIFEISISHTTHQFTGPILFSQTDRAQRYKNEIEKIVTETIKIYKNFDIQNESL